MIIKKFFLAIVSSLYYFSAFSQITLNSLDTLNISNPCKKTVSQRISNKSFLNQTLNYSELSWVALPGCDRGSPKDYYILSADIVPEFVIGGSWFRFPIHLTPRYKVRIFHDNIADGDSSLPVRTPSYMPGGTIYIPCELMDNETLNIKYFSFSIFHHSNGQDGNEFKLDESFNLYNGNFSTNFIEPAFHFRHRTMTNLSTSNCNDILNPYNDLYGKIGIEFHFDVAQRLRSSYGMQRINLQAGYIFVKSYCDNCQDTQIGSSYYREKFRLIANMVVFAGKRDHDLDVIKKRLNIDLGGYWRVPSSPSTSLFLEVGYYGSDPYNIYYSENYCYIRGGIALGFFVTPSPIGLK